MADRSLVQIWGKGVSLLIGKASELTENSSSFKGKSYAVYVGGCSPPGRNSLSLGHHDLGRSQHAVVVHEAQLDHLDDGVGRLVRGGHLGDGLGQVVVVGLA